MKNLRIVAIIFIVVGFVTPWLIDAYETANSLDISRNVGSLPWLIMLIVGVFILIYSFAKRNKG